MVQGENMITNKDLIHLERAYPSSQTIQDAQKSAKSSNDSQAIHTLNTLATEMDSVIQSDPSKPTALIAASSLGLTNLVKLLINSGASAGKTNKKKQTAIDTVLEKMNPRAQSSELTNYYDILFFLVDKSTTESHQHTKNLVQAALVLAHALIRENKTKEAISPLTQVLNLDPDHIDALALRGKCGIETRENVIESLNDCRKVLLLEPKNLTAIMAMFCFYAYTLDHSEIKISSETSKSLIHYLIEFIKSQTTFNANESFEKSSEKLQDLNEKIQNLCFYTNRIRSEIDEFHSQLGQRLIELLDATKQDIANLTITPTTMTQPKSIAEMLNLSQRIHNVMIMLTCVPNTFLQAIKVFDTLIIDTFERDKSEHNRLRVLRKKYENYKKQPDKDKHSEILMILEGLTKTLEFDNAECQLEKLINSGLKSSMTCKAIEGILERLSVYTETKQTILSKPIMQLYKHAISSFVDTIFAPGNESKKQPLIAQVLQKTQPFIMMECYDPAIAIVDAILQKDASHKEARITQCKLYIRQSNYKQSLATLKQLSASEPNDKRIRDIKSVCNLYLGTQKLFKVNSHQVLLKDAHIDDESRNYLFKIPLKGINQAKMDMLAPKYHERVDRFNREYALEKHPIMLSISDKNANKDQFILTFSISVDICQNADDCIDLLLPTLPDGFHTKDHSIDIEDLIVDGNFDNDTIRHGNHAFKLNQLKSIGFTVQQAYRLFSKTLPPLEGLCTLQKSEFSTAEILTVCNDLVQEQNASQLIGLMKKLGATLGDICKIGLKHFALSDFAIHYPKEFLKLLTVHISADSNDSFAHITQHKYRLTEFIPAGFTITHIWYYLMSNAINEIKILTLFDIGYSFDDVVKLDVRPREKIATVIYNYPTKRFFVHLPLRYILDYYSSNADSPDEITAPILLQKAISSNHIDIEVLNEQQRETLRKAVGVSRDKQILSALDSQFKSAVIFARNRLGFRTCLKINNHCQPDKLFDIVTELALRPETYQTDTDCKDIFNDITQSNPKLATELISLIPNVFHEKLIEHLRGSSLLYLLSLLQHKPSKLIEAVSIGMMRDESQYKYLKPVCNTLAKIAHSGLNKMLIQAFFEFTFNFSSTLKNKILETIASADQHPHSHEADTVFKNLLIAKIVQFKQIDHETNQTIKAHFDLKTMLHHSETISDICLSMIQDIQMYRNDSLHTQGILEAIFSFKPTDALTLMSLVPNEKQPFLTQYIIQHLPVSFIINMIDYKKRYHRPHDVAMHLIKIPNYSISSDEHQKIIKALTSLSLQQRDYELFKTYTRSISTYDNTDNQQNIIFKTFLAESRELLTKLIEWMDKSTKASLTLYVKNNTSLLERIILCNYDTLFVELVREELARDSTSIDLVFEHMANNKTYKPPSFITHNPKYYTGLNPKTYSHFRTIAEDDIARLINTIPREIAIKFLTDTYCQDAEFLNRIKFYFAYFLSNDDWSSITNHNQLMILPQALLAQIETIQKHNQGSLRQSSELIYKTRILLLSSLNTKACQLGFWNEYMKQYQSYDAALSIDIQSLLNNCLIDLPDQPNDQMKRFLIRSSAINPFSTLSPDSPKSATDAQYKRSKLENQALLASIINRGNPPISPQELMLKQNVTILDLLDKSKYNLTILDLINSGFKVSNFGWVNHLMVPSAFSVAIDAVKKLFIDNMHQMIENLCMTAKEKNLEYMTKIRDPLLAFWSTDAFYAPCIEKSWEDLSFLQTDDPQLVSIRDTVTRGISTLYTSRDNRLLNTPIAVIESQFKRTHPALFAHLKQKQFSHWKSYPTELISQGCYTPTEKTDILSKLFDCESYFNPTFRFQILEPLSELQLAIRKSILKPGFMYEDDMVHVKRKYPFIYNRRIALLLKSSRLIHLIGRRIQEANKNAELDTLLSFPQFSSIAMLCNTTLTPPPITVNLKNMIGWRLNMTLAPLLLDPKNNHKKLQWLQLTQSPHLIKQYIHKKQLTSNEVSVIIEAITEKILALSNLDIFKENLKKHQQMADQFKGILLSYLGEIKSCLFKNGRFASSDLFNQIWDLLATKCDNQQEYGRFLLMTFFMRKTAIHHIEPALVARHALKTALLADEIFILHRIISNHKCYPYWFHRTCNTVQQYRENTFGSIIKQGRIIAGGEGSSISARIKEGAYLTNSLIDPNSKRFGHVIFAFNHRAHQSKAQVNRNKFLPEQLLLQPETEFTYCTHRNVDVIWVGQSQDISLNHLVFIGIPDKIPFVDNYCPRTYLVDTVGKENVFNFNNRYHVRVQTDSDNVHYVPVVKSSALEKAYTMLNSSQRKLSGNSSRCIPCSIFVGSAAGVKKLGDDSNYSSSNDVKSHAFIPGLTPIA